MSKTTEMPGQLLSVKKTAELFDVSEKTVRRMIADGRLETMRVGRQYRIEPETIRRLLARGRV